MTGTLGPEADELPDFPVIVVHLEDPPGSGLAACCGLPFTPSDGNGVRWGCTGCLRLGRRGRDGLTVERLAAVIPIAWERLRSEGRGEHPTAAAALAAAILAALRDTP